MELADVTKAIDAHRVRVTDHADEEAAADRLTLDEVLKSVRDGEIIEHYPDDKPYPSCLISGNAATNEPVHSVWGYNEANGWAVLITVYRPDPNLWIDWHERRG